MNGLFLVANIIGTFFDVLINLRFFEVMLQSKPNKFLNTLVITFVSFGLKILTITFCSSTISVICNFISIILISLLFKQSMIKRLFYSIFIFISSILSEVVVGVLISGISSLSIEILRGNIFYYLQGALISKIFLFTILVIFKHKKNSHFNSSIPKYLYIPLISLPIATFLIIFVISELITETAEKNILLVTFISVVAITISNVLLIYLLEYNLKQTAEKEEANISKTIDSYKINYYKELVQKHKSSNKAIHDLKNQLFAIYTNIENNQEQALSQINQICDNAFSTKTLQLTKIDAIDALISSKFDIMKSKNIDFNPIIFLTKQISIDEMQLCVLIGNLLDNAIEANVKISDKNHKFIDMSIKQQNNYLSIHIQNPVISEVNFNENNEAISDKKEKHLHGFGIKSIKEICEKLSGNCTFTCDNQVFNAAVMIFDN